MDERVPTTLMSSSRMLLLILGLGLVAPAIAQEKPLHHFLAIEDRSNVSLAYVWLDISQEVTAREVDMNGARPTVAPPAVPR